ncbi:hypothetical protein HNR62_000233 [Oceanisphaera litoralis]|uniref:AbrB family transcriptional regulator n=1 Tax=Oceanisphaera sediminis TaxID=981381 RepID=A0ABP7DRD9_9GAMM|nr:hypothetical protein [Oceanisphaera litoralis]MBM7454404.1 hypothetical protein [Oceanisphaera litoralis]
MLARKRSYTLKSGDTLHANIIIQPCGTIEIDIPEKHQHITSELERVHFKLSGEDVLLVCNEKGCSSIDDICLHLSRRDAFDLNAVIDDVIKEYEELMSDL